VAPFLILTFSGSLQAWSRVYFYAVIGTAALMVFFASPGKNFVKKELARRDARILGVDTAAVEGGGKEGDRNRVLSRSASSDSLASSREPVMGISTDLEREFDDAMGELRAEVEMRKRKGN
jgi:lysophospholipid acyltransferase